ncbi:ribonuclease HI [Corynebacterium lizhenjunii]|uniref:ribonuclease HI n=1 Tax=Corynebacterium lizhenjunii TaxID=2709394 RepID=UPI0013EAF4DD|nr:ribonuclease HI [Corynebacterium lizhenjunii]
MSKPTPVDLTTLIGKASRTYSTRKVTTDMVNSRTHVAIALWDIPYKSAPHGKLHGWVISVDVAAHAKHPARRFVRTGKTMDADPNPRVLAEVHKALRHTPQRRWIVVGRRQTGLAGLLRKEGFAVTGSFAEENRAGDRARNLRKQHEAQALKRSRKAGEAPEKATAAVEAPPTHWLPNRSSMRRRGQEVRIATDASSDTLTKGCMCFVASNGDYQLRTRMTTAGTDELELETITMALKYAHRNRFPRVVIESDSVAALEAVDHILGGGQDHKRWRGVSPTARSRFRTAWKDYHTFGKATIGRVLGHAGDPLNQAADRIAYLGLRASNLPQAQSQPTAWREIDKIIAQLPGRLSR